MSEQHPTGIGRRSFMKAAGTVAGASLLGVGTAVGADGAEFDPAFANWRVREARKVWDRGFTGRADRTIGLTDTGIDARHPDLGPWNGITAVGTVDGLVLTTADQLEGREKTEVGSHGPFTGEATPGAVAESESDQVIVEFTPADHMESVDASAPYALDAQLEWTPFAENNNDLELRLDRRVDGSWEPVETAATANATEELVEVPIDPNDEYRYVAEKWLHSVSQYEVSGTFHRLGQIETVPAETAFEDGSSKTVGWYDAGADYGSYDRPRDENGHGTHCASIMGGSGRASTVDESGLIQEDPHATLLPTDFLAYEVECHCDGGIFAAAYGDLIELEIEAPDGRTIETGGIHADHSLFDNNLIDHPAVHDSGTATYTVYVKPAQEPDTGTRGVGRADRISVGPLLPPEEAADGSRDGDVSLHAGLAPDASLVGLQGLGDPTADLGEFATDFRDLFNMRAVNMSWGYVGGAPLGAAAGELDDTVASVREIAHGGILPVAAAGNSFTPANGNGAPGVADEALSVVATDPVDGLTSYSSGGLGGVDEDASDEGDSEAYAKPDVSAPGGAADGYPAGGFDLVRAAMNGVADEDEDAQPPIRDYTLKAGTSMAAPYVTGAVGLLAEAMEGPATGGPAPSAIALPAPEETTYEDVMRLKQGILATASETAFTAAPFHHPTHRPTYQFGDRDPYEGYGRVNPDAAVDAVSRNLLPGTMQLGPEESVARSDVGDVREVLGLNVPEDPRAVAGHVLAHEGTVEADVAFSHFAGGNQDLAEGDPHVDVFVYDAETPVGNGEPNVVASAQATEGVASLSLPVGEDDADVYYVVAKLVNVPGAFNTHDVQVHLDLDVSFTASSLPPFTAAGNRADDGAAFTAGQTDQIEVTITDVSAALDDDETVRIFDHTPWHVDDQYGDAETYEADEDRVDLGTATAAEIRAGGVTRTYFAEAPGSTGQYEFGPATAKIVGDASDFDNSVGEFGGTDTNSVVGVSTNTDDTASSATDETSAVDDGSSTDETSTAEDADDSVTSTTDSLL